MAFDTQDSFVLLPAIEREFLSVEQAPRYQQARRDLADYADRYSVAGDYATAQIAADDDRIRMLLTQDLDFNEAFLRVAPNTFCFAADPERNPMLFFKTDVSGSVTGLQFLTFLF